MKYKIKDNIFDVDTDNQKIILDSDTGKYYELNITAKYIFKCLEHNPKTLEEVYACLKEDINFKDGAMVELQKFLDDQPFISSSK